jgi:hypothetical protein
MLMTKMVDRPWPVNYEYRGVKAKIDFKWGRADNPVPLGLRIEIDHEKFDGQVLTESATYPSFEVALERGEVQVRGQIDRVLGPQD